MRDAEKVVAMDEGGDLGTTGHVGPLPEMAAKHDRELVGRHGAFAIREAGSSDMGTQMLLSQLVHQSSDRTPYRGGQMQRFAAGCVGLDNALECGHLTGDAPDAPN